MKESIRLIKGKYVNEKPWLDENHVDYDVDKKVSNILKNLPLRYDFLS